MGHVFLSHARADAGDPYFRRFLEDFTAELRGALGADPAEALLFRDADSIALGAPWEPALEQALRTCRIFLALLSPTYLRRPACGMEWAYFEQRRRQHGATQHAGLLVPLVWIRIPKANLPPAVAQLQHAHADLGPTYAAHGLRCVVQNDTAEYRSLLRVLAEHVRDLLRRPPLPPSQAPVNPNALPDPFEGGAPQAPHVADAPSAAGGPSHVRFVVVAATRDEIEAHRQTITSYGSSFLHWRPYLPEVEATAGLLLQTAAIATEHTSALHEIPVDIAGYLRDTAVENTPVVLVVDVWSLRIDAYRSFMNQFDTRRSVNAGVLVVWNLSDEETRGNRGALWEALYGAFPHLMVVRDPEAFHDQLGTPEELSETLRSTLTVLRHRIAMFGNVIRAARGERAIPQPQLEGPGAT